MRKRSATEQALGILGLVRRSGRAVLGTGAVTELARSGRLELVVMAGDAARGIRSRADEWARRGIRVLELADRSDLGRAVGRNRVTVVGVTDRRWAELLYGRLAARDEGSDGGPLEGRKTRRSTFVE